MPVAQQVRVALTGFGKVDDLPSDGVLDEIVCVFGPQSDQVISKATPKTRVALGLAFSPLRDGVRAWVCSPWIGGSATGSQPPTPGPMPLSVMSGTLCFQPARRLLATVHKRSSSPTLLNGGRAGGRLQGKPPAAMPGRLSGAGGSEASISRPACPPKFDRMPG